MTSSTRRRQPSGLMRRRLSNGWSSCVPALTYFRWIFSQEWETGAFGLWPWEPRPLPGDLVDLPDLHQILSDLVPDAARLLHTVDPLLGARLEHRSNLQRQAPLPQLCQAPGALWHRLVSFESCPCPCSFPWILWSSGKSWSCYLPRSRRMKTILVSAEKSWWVVHLFQKVEAEPCVPETSCTDFPRLLRRTSWKMNLWERACHSLEKASIFLTTYCPWIHCRTCRLPGHQHFPTPFQTACIGSQMTS